MNSLTCLEKRTERSVQQQGFALGKQMGRRSVILSAARWKGSVDPEDADAIWLQVLAEAYPWVSRAPYGAGILDLRDAVGDQSDEETILSLINDWAARQEVSGTPVWGPLIAHQWFQVGQDDFVHAFALDHEWADQATCHGLVSRLVDRANGLSSDVPAPYTDFVEWQSSQDVGLTAEYWSRTVPRDHSPLRWGPATVSSSAFRHTRQPLNPTLAGAIQAESSKGEHRLQALILAATTRVLQGSQGTRKEVDFALATTRPGRPDSFEHTAGCFVDSFPVFVRLEDTDAALVEHIRGQLLDVGQATLPIDATTTQLRREGLSLPRPQVYATVDDSPVLLGRTAEATVSVMDLHRRAGNYPCGVVLRTGSGQPYVEVLAKAGPHQDRAVERVAQQITAALASMLGVHHEPVKTCTENTENATGLTAEKGLAGNERPSAAIHEQQEGSVLSSPRIQETILQAWRDGLGRSDIGPDDNFFDVGGDSFTAVQIMTDLDLDIPVVDIFDHPSARQLAAHAQGEAPTGQLLLRHLGAGEASPDAVDLIVIPFGGGDAAIARPLADAWGASARVHAAQLPGHPGAPQEEVSAADLASRIADQMDLDSRAPLVVYGHCAGTGMAAALAMHLQDLGRTPDLLVLAAGVVPEDPRALLKAELSTSDEEWAGYLRSIGGLTGLDHKATSAVLQAGRCDHRLSMSAHLHVRQHPSQLRCPTLCILGDVDPATPNLTAIKDDWAHIAPQTKLAVLPGAGHYFIGTHSGVIHALVDHALTEIS